MKNITKIVLIIILVAILLIKVYLIYRFTRNYLQIYKATKYAFNNTLVCPDQKNNDLFCHYINKDLPEPTPDATVLTFSKYAANLVGKLEYLYDPPLPVVLKIYYDNNLFGWILKGTSAYYVIYRGTRTAEEWARDFNYYQNSNFSLENLQSQPSASQKSLLPNLENRGSRAALRDISVMNKGNDIMVHQGFLDVYGSFKKEVMDKLNEDTSKLVLITGHSLGAAIAILNGIDLTLGGRQNRTIVFAPPRVGNTSFANLLNSQKTLLKWINTSDVIPTTPYSVSPNFKDPENPYFFTDGGPTNYFTLNNKSLVNNHSMATYIQYMDGISA